MTFFHDVYELNYSKIKTYRECPLLYKYKYIEGKRDGLVPASSLGVSIHRTLEAYHKKSNDPSELQNYYNKSWLSAGYSSAAEQQEYYLKGQRMLELYAEREYGRETTVDSSEREFIFKHGIWTIRGKVDRVDRWPDGSWEVIDYKTGTEIDENFEVENSLQMAIYACGAKRAWNMKEGKASIYLVALDKIISSDFKNFNDEETLKIFIDTGKKIECNDFEPNTNFCPKCHFRNRCPASTARDII